MRPDDLKGLVLMFPERKSDTKPEDSIMKISGKIILFILILIVFTGCNNSPWQRIPCTIVSNHIRKCDEIYGFEKNYITDVTISYEVNGKIYKKEFDLSGTYSFKPGEICYCYVRTEKPEYVRLDLSPDVAPK